MESHLAHFVLVPMLALSLPRETLQDERRVKPRSSLGWISHNRDWRGNPAGWLVDEHGVRNLTPPQALVERHQRRQAEQQAGVYRPLSPCQMSRMLHQLRRV